MVAVGKEEMIYIFLDTACPGDNIQIDKEVKPKIYDVLLWEVYYLQPVK